MGLRGGGAPTVDILVGTPGRMIDHLENTAGFREALQSCRTLVLDEVGCLGGGLCVLGEEGGGSLCVRTAAARSLSVPLTWYCECGRADFVPAVQLLLTPPPRPARVLGTRRFVVALHA
jgi:hypothetical protein